MSLAAAFVCLTLAIGTAPSDEQMTPPPGEETPEVRARIDAVEKTLESGSADATAVLDDPARLDLHEYPRFREAIRRHPATGATTLVTPSEPGERLVVTGTVRSKSGEPVAGALLYAYHTSAKGWYSDRAAHYAANSGDEKHARLFGYVVTDAGGRYEIRTIRPMGYPRSDLPQHIHVEIAVAASTRTVTEIRFEDDPRLTPAQREASKREGFLVVPLSKDPDGTLRVTADFTL